MARKQRKEAGTVKYTFAAGSRLKGNPQRVGAELTRILQRQPDERADPATIVEAARSPRSYLHRYFQWDDAKAATAYRLDQARHLMRHLAIVYRDGEREVSTRGFISLSNEGGYRTFGSAVRNLEYRKILLADAQRDVEQMRAKYAALTELEPAFSTIAQLIHELLTGAVSAAA